MDVLTQDLRFAIRSLTKRPGVTVAALLILAVGMGATTTIFSVVDTVLIRPLPYPEPGQLAYFTEGSHSIPSFKLWRDSAGSFTSVGAAWTEELDLTGEGDPEHVQAAMVTPELLPLFGASIQLGRPLAETDFDGEPAVALLSAGFWQRRFGGDDGVLGRRLRLGGRSVVVVGILHPAFDPPEAVVGERVDLWLPLDVDVAELDVRGMQFEMQDHGLHVLSVVGRLSEGASIEAAQAEIDALREAQAAQVPDYYTGREGEVRRVPLVTLHEATVGEISPTLYLLLGAVGLMLLISCANVANLFLAKGTERAREMALRGALGASRGRLALQLLTESVLLAVVGGAAGVAFAYLGVDLFSRYDPGGIPRLQTVGVDLRILIFTLALSVATGILFGILPAFQASRASASETLKEGTASVTSSRGGRRARGALVVAEIAVALVLLVGAGLLFRSLIAMVRVDPGFDTEQIVTFTLQLGSSYEEEQRTRFAADLLERVAAIPGTEVAGAGWTLPFVYHGGSRCCWRTAVRPDSDTGEEMLSIIHPVTPGYFETLRAAVAYGRTFVEGDGEAGPVAIINRPTANQLFGNDNAVGKTIRVRDEPFTVIGVIEGVHHWGLSQDVEYAVYVPFSRWGGMLPELRVAMRSSAELGPAAEALRATVWSLDPDLPIGEIITMRQRVSGSLAAPRFLALLFGSFAGVALLLACGGVYSSMLYLVGQRQRELGIRVALGASGSDVIGLVLRHALLVTVAGLGIGIGGALAASRLLASLVWGVGTNDAWTFAAVTLILAASALAPCAIPAWKAAGADPLEALRAE